MTKKKNLTYIRIAYVESDDINYQLQNYVDYQVMETGQPLMAIDEGILSANGYIGVKGTVEALENNADIIITGRVADPSLALEPLVYKFGWAMDDYNKLGKETWIGHLSECAGQVTRGCYADPGYEDVPELWNLGFPIIEVDETEGGIVTKSPHIDGIVTTETMKEQTLYEIQDSVQYFTPDVIADFSHVRVEQLEEDIAKISGATGHAPNSYCKTSVDHHDRYIGEGQISCGGYNVFTKAQLAKEALKHHFEMIGSNADGIRYGYIGLNSLYQDHVSDQLLQGVSFELKLRVAARVKDYAQAQIVDNEIETLYTNGPSNGGGATKDIKDIIGIASILVPTDHFEITVGYLEV